MKSKITSYPETLMRACLKSSSRREEALTASAHRVGKRGYLSLVTSAATMNRGVFKQTLSRRSARLCCRSAWAGLAACVAMLLCLTGCQSSKAPGSSSLAAVMIYESNVSAIREATLAVFNQNEYTRLPSDRTDFVFEREGTKWDSAMYGSFGDGSLWIRVEVKIEPYGNAHLLRCDAFAVSNHGDAFFSEKHRIRSLRGGDYKKLLVEVRNKVIMGPK